MAIAALAYPQLTAAARQRIDTLLKHNPDYAVWVRDIDSAERERVAFMRAATWPDAIKGKRDYRDAPRQREGATGAGSGYRDRYLHRGWHYINTPYSPDGTPVRRARTPNLLTQLDALIETLQAPSLDDETRSHHLVWVLHLVGDAHQPLHAIARVTRDLPDGDQGGNAIAVCGRRCDRDLHGFWDGVLGNSRKPEVVLRALSQFGKPAAQRVAELDPEHWIAESADLARRVAYAPPVPTTAESVTLSKRYKAEARAAAQQQAAVAGTRLARLLNQLFDESSGGARS